MIILLGELWHSLKRYPLILLLAGSVIGIVIGWFFGQRSTSEEISIPPAKATTFTMLSNQELKNKSAQLVTAIRGLARAYYDEDDRMRSVADMNIAKSDSRAEQEQVRNAWLNASAKLHDALMDRYKINFWADALLLREAIVARVGGVPGAHNPILFQHPTNILGIQQIANNLELLGKSLPEK